MPHRRVEPEGDKQPAVGDGAGDRCLQQRIALLVGQRDDPTLAFCKLALAEPHWHAVKPLPFDGAVEQVRQGGELAIYRGVGGALSDAALLIGRNRKFGDRVEPLRTEMRDQVHPQLPTLDSNVFPAALLEALQVALCRIGKGQGEFTPLGQRQAAGARLGPFLLNKFLALGAGHALARFADGAMDPLAVDHNADRIAEIAISQPLGRDPVLVNFLAWLQLPDQATIKFRVS